jgi:AcrR family transcriptional regulator
MSTRARGGRRERLVSIDDILAAGLKVADEEGLEAVSMRRVGDEVGVGAMTLYRYVQSKEDLLDGIANLVLGVLPGDDPEHHHWRQRLERSAHHLHNALRDHPGVAEIIAARRHPIPALDRWRETQLGILLDAGLRPEHAVQTVSALAAYTAGFAHAQRYRTGAEPETEATRLRRLPREDFPLLAEHANLYAGHLSQDAFTFGLRTFVDGLASGVEASDNHSEVTDPSHTRAVRRHSRRQPH